jgi:hypothetical protein
MAHSIDTILNPIFFLLSRVPLISPTLSASTFNAPIASVFPNWYLAVQVLHHCPKLPNLELYKVC